MNATISNYKDTIYRLRMNKKTKTIKIDVYYLDTVKKETYKIKEYPYMYTLHCIGMSKQDFNYYYNNYMTYNDVRSLAKTADKSSHDYSYNHKIKLN